MEINKVLNVMALYFLPFQIYAKEEITFPIIKETNSTNSGFFYDSFVSSFTLAKKSPSVGLNKL